MVEVGSPLLFVASVGVGIGVAGDAALRGVRGGLVGRWEAAHLWEDALAHKGNVRVEAAVELLAGGGGRGGSGGTRGNSSRSGSCGNTRGASKATVGCGDIVGLHAAAKGELNRLVRRHRQRPRRVEGVGGIAISSIVSCCQLRHGGGPQRFRGKGAKGDGRWGGVAGVEDAWAVHAEPREILADPVGGGEGGLLGGSGAASIDGRTTVFAAGHQKAGAGERRSLSGGWLIIGIIILFLILLLLHI